MKRILALTVKDIRSDVRGKEIAPSMIIFALVLVFLFTFALPPGIGRAPIPSPRAGAVAGREVAGSFLWIALLFASLIGFGRNAAQEREGGRIDALVLAPVDPAALFFSKAAANFVFLAALEVVMVPAFIVFFDIRAATLFPGLIAVLISADAGLAATGTLFGAASQYARVREIVLPLLVFPIVLPLVLAATKLTTSILSFGDFAGETRWFILMAAFDLSIIAIGAVTFEFVIRE